ncbi:S-layer homology domain-containing protein [uncultured Dialister sp.]|uniref:S-layer homology domain-containing protein n=1 Tax=uncultured Dialister sp. TaxID=278064 RepID=UPI0025CB8837|nr:S-layer homology domain-containing protein [uncultured Dialister sp.]
MKHSLLKIAAAAVMTCAAWTVSAANPFADVDESSWAYKAVSQLSEDNVIDGYPDGTFRGDKNVSRYELAQIIARLMQKENLSDSQKATVQKLSAEYADELTSLGVRVSELEKKTGNLSVITELRVQDVPRYSNIFKSDKEKYDELSLRTRVNIMANVNPRSTVYGQLESFTSLNGKDVFDPNMYNWKSENDDSIRSGHGDSDMHMNRLWATYHFGKKQDTSKLPFGPSKNLIGIGQFPVKMGVTGYTYDGQFKGAFVSFGDYQKGGRFTIAHGRATDINYNYTGPMMRGINTAPLAKALIGSKADDLKALAGSLMGNPELMAQLQKLAPAELAGLSKNLATLQSSNNTSEMIGAMKGLGSNLSGIGSKMAAVGTATSNQQLIAQGTQLSTAGNGISATAAKTADGLTGTGYFDPNTSILYPMGSDTVMGWGEDEDVPVTYMSYIYKKPMNWEFHAYAMKANGPVGNICKAYGFAGAYYITPKWHIQGEYVKNLRKLPLNNEKPYSFNYGLHYGTTNILQKGSYQIGLDYVYSQAGTYFGGSSDAITDQYMGHVYKNWHGMKNVPAYFADKVDGINALGPVESNKHNYGGAKFFLAKAGFVPMKGLLIEAEYGFKAEDMGGRKMDDMLMLKATAYIK